MKNNEKKDVIIPIEKRKELRIIFPDYINEREKNGEEYEEKNEKKDKNS